MICRRQNRKENIKENEMLLNKNNENLTDEEILQKERHDKIIQQRKNMITTMEH